MPFTGNISFELENIFLEEGCKIIAGVDEAGRGALAGHLSVSLVIFQDTFIKNPHYDILEKVRDSKKLSPGKRTDALNFIKKHSLYTVNTLVSHRLVDRLNINRATEYAIGKLLKKIPLRPDVIMMDGNFSFDIGIPMRSIVKGDSLSFSIASASIAAKVTRDRIIEKFDLIYPGYSFKNNKGYGTAEHIKAIIKNGPSPIHRKSYEPVRSMLDDSARLFNDQ